MRDAFFFYWFASDESERSTVENETEVTDSMAVSRFGDKDIFYSAFRFI